MKKANLLTMLIAGALAIASNAFAGGYLTNTNQSIYFLRNPARDAAIGIDGVYFNPAGAAFYNEGEGFHLQFNWQNAHQKRDAYATYGNLYKLNYLNPPEADGGREFKGRVNVPIQPSLFALYNLNGWSFQAGIGVLGGGGGCEFEDGVGSFEALVGRMGERKFDADFAGYSLDSYVLGKSYNFGLQVAVARKLTDNFSVSFGLRGVYATNHYEAYIRNIKFKSQTLGEIAVPSNYELDCDQKGFGISPIISVDWKAASWVNISAKYEFGTKITVESDAHNSADFDALAASNSTFAGYLDGAETKADVPGLLTIGAQFTPIEKLRIGVGYHHYMDAATRQWTKDRLGDSNEFTFGAEYDINEKLEVSAGYQKTYFDQTDANISDMSFSLSSYSFGFGLGYRVNEKIKLNAAYFQTVYDDYTKTVPSTSVTTYSRTNMVIGVGIDFTF